MSTSLIPILVFGIPGIIFLFLGLGYIVYRGFAAMPPKDEASIRSWCLERGDLEEGDLELPWIVDHVASPGGYEIEVHALEGEGRGLVIVQHGITMSWFAMMRHIKAFHAEGWTVIAPDSRGHGGTGGGRPSYGWHERHDLEAVADWAFARFPRATRFPRAAHFEGAARGEPRSDGIDVQDAAEAHGLFAALGVSMGAATVLQYAPLDPRLDFVVADCPFSSLAAELDHRLRRAMLPFFMRSLILRIADAFCRSNEGYSIYDIRPERSMLETSLPILFIHGQADDYVPWKMSVAMAKRRQRELPDTITELKLVPEAKHARSIAVDPELYARSLREFAEHVSARMEGAKA